MSTISEELIKLVNTKNDIKQALVNKGQTPTDKFDTYDEHINNIKGVKEYNTYSEMYDDKRNIGYDAVVKVINDKDEGKNGFYTKCDIETKYNVEISDYPTEIQINSIRITNYGDFGIRFKMEEITKLTDYKLNISKDISGLDNYLSIYIVKEEDFYFNEDQTVSRYSLNFSLPKEDANYKAYGVYRKYQGDTEGTIIFYIPKWLVEIINNANFLKDDTGTYYITGNRQSIFKNLIFQKYDSLGLKKLVNSRDIDLYGR